jgi:hypothetical protein
MVFVIKKHVCMLMFVNRLLIVHVSLAMYVMVAHFCLLFNGVLRFGLFLCVNMPGVVVVA